MRRILFFAFPLGLASCALPGRPVSPYANAPSLVDVAALSSFNGVLPLITVPENTANWPDSVSYAVAQSLKIKPEARFRVVVTAPSAATPGAQQHEMSRLAPEAASIANAIAADGVGPSRVSLAAQGAPIPHVAPPAGPEILVFAK
jgi:hypothetical protein